MGKEKEENGLAKFKASDPIGSKKTVHDLMPMIQSSMSNQPIDAPRLGEAAMFCINKSPDLLKCTIGSFGAALMNCAKYGLFPDILGQCFLIPRSIKKKVGGKDVWVYEAQFQIGYQGLLTLVRRSKTILKVEARVVYDADKFEYWYGIDSSLKHTPARANRGKLSAAYAIAWFRERDLPQQFVVMEREDIEKVRECSQTADKTWSPWNEWEEMMWMKSAAIRLTKYLQQEVEVLSSAVGMDDLSMVGKSQTHDGEVKGLDYGPTVNSLGVKPGMIDADDLLLGGSQEQEAETVPANGG